MQNKKPLLFANVTVIRICIHKTLFIHLVLFWNFYLTGNKHLLTLPTVRFFLLDMVPSHMFFKI